MRDDGDDDADDAEHADADDDADDEGGVSKVDPVAFSHDCLKSPAYLVLPPLQVILIAMVMVIMTVMVMLMVMVMLTILMIMLTCFLDAAVATFARRVDAMGCSGGT